MTLKAVERGREFLNRGSDINHYMIFLLRFFTLIVLHSGEEMKLRKLFEMKELHTSKL